MTALPNAKSMLSSAIDTVNKPYADATATTQETVSRVSSSNFSSIDENVKNGLFLSSCSGGGCYNAPLPSSFPLVAIGRMHGKRRRPGAMGSCSATAGGLRLGSLGLKSDALGLPSALTRNRDNQLFRGLGQRRVRADTARGTLDCLDLGDGRDSAVDGSCSRRRQLEEADRSSRTLLVHCSHTRAHTTYERISSWGSLAWPVLRRRGSLELLDR